MKYWSKSSLLIYRYLETMSKSLDKIIDNTGRSSNSVSLQKYQSTYFQTNKIIELIERKRKVINLKVAVENSLAKVSKTSRRLLTLFYIDGVKAELIAQLLGVSLRTVFRKKIAALKDFAACMEIFGFDSEYFEKEYGYENWFISVYSECVIKSTSEEECENLIDNLILRRIMDELSNISIAYNTYI